MAGGENEPSVLADLTRFVQLAGLLDQGESQRSAAGILEIPPSTAAYLMRRFEAQYGPLVQKGSQPPMTSRLTASGKHLLHRARSFIEWEPMREGAVLSVSIPQTLMNSQPLMRAVTGFLNANRTRFNFTASQSVHVAQLAEDVSSGCIDFAAAWSEPRNPIPQSSSVTYCYDTLEVVLISHSVRYLTKALETLPSSDNYDDMNTALYRAMKGFRIAVMASHNQPFAEAIATPSLGDRLLIDNIDGAVSAVASEMADIAVIPALYSHLLHHQHSGRLCWSNSIGAMNLVSMHRSNESELLPRSFQKLVSNSIREEVRFRVPRTLGYLPFPTSSSEDGRPFERKWYGYYIDVSRDLNSPLEQPDDDRVFATSPVRSVAAARARWRSESLCLTYVRDLEDGDSYYRGTIRNEHGDSFDVRATAAPGKGGRLVLVADPVSEMTESSDQSRVLSGFVSVFTRCAIYRSRATVYAGNWIGLDNLNEPAVFATILSTLPLSAEDIDRISAEAASRTVLLADAEKTLSSVLPTVETL